MNDNIRSAITRAYESGVTARHTVGNRTVLPTTTLGPRAFQVLAQADGTVTPAGRFYYNLTGEQEDHTFDPQQRVSRRGDTEYVRDRSGREVTLRTLLPTGDFRYTRAGKSYFRQVRGEFVAQVPVIINGTRANGTHYTRRDWLPTDEAGIDRIEMDTRLPAGQRDARVRALASQQFDPLKISGETFTIDPHGEWFIQ